MQWHKFQFSSGCASKLSIRGRLRHWLMCGPSACGSQGHNWVHMVIICHVIVCRLSRGAMLQRVAPKAMSQTTFFSFKSWCWNCQSFFMLPLQLNSWRYSETFWFWQNKNSTSYSFHGNGSFEIIDLKLVALWAMAVIGGSLGHCCDWWPYKPLFFLRHVTFPFSAISFALVAPWAMSCDFK